MARVIPGWELVPPFENGELCAGIDEVGRGAWAGPVVAAAVILPYGIIIDGLADSKVVAPAARVHLNREIRRVALSIGIGWVHATELDRAGLSWAVRESGLRALAALNLEASHIMLDGKHNYLADDPRATVIVKGDALVAPIAAASLVAKVARDRYMAALGHRLTAYGFEYHKGYGTARHRQAIQADGVTTEHRLSFRPLQDYVTSRQRLAELGKT